MEKFFTQELMWMLGIAGVAGIGLMTLTGRFVAKAQGSFQPHLKRSVIYILVFMLVSALFALSGISVFFRNPGITYIVIQVLCILLAVVHIRGLKKYIRWTDNPRTFWLEILFTIVLIAFGYLSFILVFKFFNRDGYHYLMGTSLFWILIAMFVYRCFQLAIAIPVKVYSLWYYPLHQEIEDPDEDKLKHMLIISFMFQKKTGDTFFTNFRAKAPVDMEFGRLFYYFINDYNERHPNDKIQFTNQMGEPFGWSFYRKPKWYELNTYFVDAEKTFFANRIRENDVIVCLRN